MTDPTLLVRTTFAVTYEHQEILLGHLARFVEAHYRHAEGFRGARLLRDLDGHHVRLETDWASRQAYENSRAVDAETVLTRFATSSTALCELAGAF